MSAVTRFEHEFVASVPRQLAPGILYVSLEYCSMQHLCACGCGRKIVTPISPNDWNMTFNGKFVTVHPSIGSWSLPCRSHYLIKRGKVVWAGGWSDEQVKRGREADLLRKRGKLELKAEPDHHALTEGEEGSAAESWPQRIMKRLLSLIR